METTSLTHLPTPPLPSSPLLHTPPLPLPPPCSRSAAACRSHTPGSPLDHREQVSPPHPSPELQTVARLLTAGPCGTKSFRSVCLARAGVSEPVCAWRASVCVCVREPVFFFYPLLDRESHTLPAPIFSLMTGFVFCCAMYMDRSSLARGECARTHMHAHTHAHSCVSQICTHARGCRPGLEAPLLHLHRPHLSSAVIYSHLHFFSF